MKKNSNSSNNKFYLSCAWCVPQSFVQINKSTGQVWELLFILNKTCLWQSLVGVICTQELNVWKQTPITRKKSQTTTLLTSNLGGPCCIMSGTSSVGSMPSDAVFDFFFFFLFFFSVLCSACCWDFSSLIQTTDVLLWIWLYPSHQKEPQLSLCEQILLRRPMLIIVALTNIFYVICAERKKKYIY